MSVRAHCANDGHNMTMGIMTCLLPHCGRHFNQSQSRIDCQPLAHLSRSDQHEAHLIAEAQP